MSLDTRTRILDGAIEAMSRTGLSRLTLEDVATVAGVSRQTVYRYFGNRESLISATIVREEEQLIAEMAAAGGAHDGLRPALEASIRAALTSARAHPLLDRLLATEPEALLPFLTTGAGPVLSAAEPVVRDLLSRHLPHRSSDELRRISEAATRLIISYAISPTTDHIDELASSLADLITRGVDPR